MSDRLKLANPDGDAEADQIAYMLEMKEHTARIKQLEKNIAALQARADKEKQITQNAPTAGGNKIGARKEGTFKAISTAPSINKTPIGPSMVPIPYPVVQDLTNSVNTARSVNFNGCPAYVLDGSKQPHCTGDEPGTGKGIKSGTVSGEVKPVDGSGTVRIEGKKVVREGDPCTMNGGNNPGIYVSTCLPSVGQPNSTLLASHPDTNSKRRPEGIRSVDSGLLSLLKPKNQLEKLLSEMHADTLRGKFPGPLMQPTPLEARQIAARRNKYFGQSFMPWDGESRSAMEKFVDNNHALYESSIGGAFYGATRLAGGDDRLGRAFGIFGNGLELSGGLTSSQLDVFKMTNGSARSNGSGVKIGTRSFFKWVISKKALSQAAKKKAELYRAWKDDVGSNYSGVESQVEAFKELVKNESPWPDGFTPKSMVLPVGTKIYMAIAPTQSPTTPGGFATQTPIADKASVRRDLAVKLLWKSDIGSAVEYEVIKPLPVRQGPVGPQIDQYSRTYLPGGLDQVNIDIPRGESRMNYLKIVDVKPLK